MRCNPFLARLDQDNVLVDGINEMMSGCIQFGFSIIQNFATHWQGEFFSAAPIFISISCEIAVAQNGINVHS